MALLCNVHVILYYIIIVHDEYITSSVSSLAYSTVSLKRTTEHGIKRFNHCIVCIRHMHAINLIRISGVFKVKPSNPCRLPILIAKPN